MLFGLLEVSPRRALMTRYQNNLGNTVELYQTSRVTKQYGIQGAEGTFDTIFDTGVDPNDSQLRIYNIVTWIGGYTLPAGEVTGRHLALLGKLIYGIGGATFEVDFDWKVGTQISIAASFVRLLAAFSEVGPACPEAVRIGAMLASGSRAARSQVTRTYPKLVFNDGAPVLFPVPPMAHALNLFSETEDFYATDEVNVRYLGGASAGFSATSTDLVSWESDGAPFLEALANEDGVRFPEATRVVEISTATADTDYSVTPCFTLSL